MAAGHVYHWKHGWIPLTYFAALQKAHGSRHGAISYLHASSGVHGSHHVGEYTSRGVHWGSAAKATQDKLKSQGLGVGSKVYWHHPGTGKQVEARIVGIEHTGHIIISHSGNRNALIGHTTYSAHPHPGVPFQEHVGPFRNPHVHTRVIEKDANGNPIYPKGFAPRASRPGNTRGRTVIDRHFPPHGIDTKPDLTPAKPKTSFALPHEFTKIDPKSITPYHTISAKARLKEGAKIREAYQLGPHKVLIQSVLTGRQREGLLNDIRDTLHTAHPNLGENGVTFLVPTGDKNFRTTARGTVLGYVIGSGSTVHINPKVATGEYESPTDKASFMPAAKGTSVRRYTITHELGHVVDNFTSKTDFHGGAHEGVRHFQNSRSGLSKYGSYNVTEGYAEAFAQHQLGGPHHGTAHTIAQEYARIYGWQKAGTS